MDAIDFFKLSAGKWHSSRTTHHLAFKRGEIGDSEIFVETLAADDPDIIAVCQMHDIDPSLAVGGSRVRWQGTMAWDREDEENHEGKTVFAIVPDADNPRKGRLLRERGYAEIVPVVGQFLMDEEDGLVLITEYETMSSYERFWFPNPNTRLRASTVKRFGGFSSATFCSETRAVEDSEADVSAATPEAVPLASVLGW